MYQVLQVSHGTPEHAVKSELQTITTIFHVITRLLLLALLLMLCTRNGNRLTILSGMALNYGNKCITLPKEWA